MDVLITGGSGLVGSHLSKKLKEKGYEVAILSRKKHGDPDTKTYLWDPGKNEIEKEAIEKAGYIVHLAGANISDKRWTKKRKQEIVDSRVETAKLLFNKVSESKTRPKAFISSSAVNYYGTLTSDKIFSEDDPPSNDFMGQTCKKWEQSVMKFEDSGIRTVILRNGVVISPKGGAIKKMSVSVKLGLGSPVGSGKQYFPWIHIEDLCNIYIKAIEDSKMQGAYNAVAPDHIKNRNVMKALADAFNRPFWAPNVPSFIIKILFGEMANILLKGSRISADKIKEAGYEFRFTNFKDAVS